MERGDMELSEKELRAELTEEEWREYQDINDLIDMDPQEPGWEIVSNAFRSLASARMANRELREHIKSIEWVRTSGGTICPSCGNTDGIHAPDCKTLKILEGNIEKEMESISD